ncbi:STAS domain-containing protein [Actinoplanes sp. NPDC024001]|uniref:STAS domain-containing protein n=1 Tax=Actinoplanes sp. NPDC024001 TaxID=3154598 RepID=UPI0033F7EA09
MWLPECCHVARRPFVDTDEGECPEMVKPQPGSAATTTNIRQSVVGYDRSVSPIRVEAHAGMALVTVRGDLRASGASMLRDVLTWAVEHHRGVVVDLSAAATIDRLGLSVLIQAQDRAHARATGLCFAEPSDVLRSALSALRADAMFVMFDLCADAFAWLRAAVSDRRGPTGEAVQLPAAAA